MSDPDPAFGTAIPKEAAGWDVAVLFCDLVGSTELLSRLGNVASEGVRRRYFALLREAVRAARGEEVKTLGDGLMVVFLAGAHDALACASAMHRGIAALSLEMPSQRLAIRVGVATGEAQFAVEEADWYGAAVNTAARLCGRADPDETFTTETAAASAGLPLCISVGELELKGLGPRVATVSVPWHDSTPSNGVPMPVALDVAEGPPLEGRAAELDCLVAAWERVKVARSEGVLVVGDAGSGKSRLARDFASQVRAAGGTVLYGRAGGDRAAGDVFGDALRWYAAALPDDDVPAVLAEVGPAAGNVTAVFAARVPTLPMALAPTEAEFTATVVALTRTAARRAPVLLVVDELHHVDEVTTRILSALVVGVPSNLLVLGLARENGTDWKGIRERLGWPEVELLALRRDEVTRMLGPFAEHADLVEVVTAGNAAFLTDVLVNLRGVPLTDIRLAREVIGRTCPYRGLSAYTTGDSPLFFGRDALVARLVDRLADTRLLGVLGPSGSGKSSLVMAGLLPALARGALPGSAEWAVLVVRPGEHALDSLSIAMAAHPAVAETPSTINRLLSDSVDGLEGLVRRMTNGPGGRVVLVVDQAEELFTATDLHERTAFVRLLLRATAVPGGPLTVVLTVRADFYGRLTEIPDLASAVEADHVLVGTMTDAELRAVVEQPAVVSGFRLEEGVAEMIVHDVAGQPGTLPLLSHVLLQTWQRREGRFLTKAGYDDAGRVLGAIASTADAAIERLSENASGHARELFLRLITPGEGSEDTRRRVERRELPVDLDSLVEPLAQARLLTAGDGVVEISHEALISSWPRLQGWLDDDREGLRLHRRLTDAASHWERGGREPSDLYSGARLFGVEAWAATNHTRLNESEGAFLATSRGRERRERRWRRLAVATLGVVTVVAVIAASVAYSQRSRAERAATDVRHRLIAAEIVASDDNVTAQLVAVALAQLSDLPEVRSALLTLALSAPAWSGSLFTPSPVGTLRASTDGRFFAMRSAAGLEMRDVATLELVSAPIRPADGGEGFGLPMNGGRELIGFDVRTRRLDRWDVDTRTSNASYTLPDVPVRSIALGDHDSLLAISTQDGQLGVFDTETLTPRLPLTRIAPAPVTMALSPTTSDVMVVWDAGATYAAQILDAKTGRLRWDLGPLKGSGYTALVQAPDGAGILVLTENGSAPNRYVDLRGDRPAITELPLSGGITAAFLPGGREALFAMSDQTLVRVDVLSAERVGAPIAIAAAPDSLFVRPDGESAIVAARGVLREFALGPRASLPGPVVPGTTSAFWSQLLPDGRILLGEAAGAGNNVVSRIVDYAGAELGRTRGSIGVSDTGYSFMTGYDGAIELREPDGSVRWRRQVGNAIPLNFALPEGAGSGRLVVATADREVLLLDATNGRTITKLTDLPVPQSEVAMAVSDVGRLAVSVHLAGATRLEFFDLTTGMRDGVPIDMPGAAVSIGFAGNDTLIVGTSVGAIVRYEVPGRKQIVGTVAGHAGAVIEVSVSKDGAAMLSVGTEGTAQLWDVPTMARLGRSFPLPPPYAIPHITADGRQLAMPTVDGIAIVDIAQDRLIDRICARTPFNLQPERLRSIIGSDPKRPPCLGKPTAPGSSRDLPRSG